MRIPRIYVDLPLEAASTFDLVGDRAHYLANVLRMTAGRQLTLFNGKGIEYSATILETHKKTLKIEVHSATEKLNESPLKLHLAQVISKGERMDFTLQKAVELGVSCVTPLFSSRCEVKLKGDRLEKKMQHWHNVMISASEQSGRATLPILNHPTELAAFLTQSDLESNRWVLSPEIEAPPLASLSIKGSGCLLIGPEGGLSPEEVSSAEQQGFQGLKLGPRVLRTETAGLVALSILQHRFGDLG